MTDYQVKITLERGEGALNFIHKFDFNNVDDVGLNILNKVSFTLDRTEKKNEWLVQLSVKWDDGEKEYMEFPYKTNIKSEDEVGFQVVKQIMIQVLKLS